jgi:hypothetical protein
MFFQTCNTMRTCDLKNTIIPHEKCLKSGWCLATPIFVSPNASTFKNTYYCNGLAHRSLEKVVEKCFKSVSKVVEKWLKSG